MKMIFDGNNHLGVVDGRHSGDGHCIRQLLAATDVQLVR